MCEKLLASDPSLTLVRGYYFCPAWNTENPHWWLRDTEGNIIDPTKKQFPSKGHGIYTEFDGKIKCEVCGKKVDEKEAIIVGNYGCCSQACALRLVGL